LGVIPEVTGSETEFSPIRNFIMGQGEVEGFVIQEIGSLIAYPTPLHRPNRYCHLLFARWGNGKAEALMRFFLGPEHEPKIFRVRLANDLATLSGSGLRGTAFVYVSDFQEEGYSGIATPVQPCSLEDAPEGIVPLFIPTKRRC
jgi:hypothetical protein